MSIKNNILHDEPLAGDYILITKSKSKEIPKGTFAVICGDVGVAERHLIAMTKPTNPFVTKTVNSGGGPALLIDPSKLKRSKRKTILRAFWRWRDGKRSTGGAESFKQEVKLFELDLTKK